MATKVLYLCTCIFEGYISYNFWKHFLRLRIKNTWFPILIMTSAMGSLFAINQLHIAGINLIASTTLNFLACFLLFNDTIKKKSFYAMLAVFIIACSEFVFMIVLNLPLGNFTLNYDIAPNKMILLAICSKLLPFLVMRIVCYLSDYGKTMFFPSLVPYFCCFPVSCLVLYIGISYSNISFDLILPAEIILLTGCVLLLVSNFILFIVYDKMNFMMNQAKECELTDVKRKLESSHYNRIEEINKKNSEILHDMNNYLLTIKDLAEKDNNKEIIQMIHSLNNKVIKIKEGQYCNHHIINAILNGKKQDAFLKQVKFDIYVEEGLVKPKIEDIDLISILSNLIDNAIEAASKLPDGFVKIQMYKVNDGSFLTIKIKNNYKDEPVLRGDKFITRKHNPTMHGIGINNVKSIVEQYRGWTHFEFEQGHFCVTIMFSL